MKKHFFLTLLVSTSIALKLLNVSYSTSEYIYAIYYPLILISFFHLKKRDVWHTVLMMLVARVCIGVICTAWRDIPKTDITIINELIYNLLICLSVILILFLHKIFERKMVLKLNFIQSLAMFLYVITSSLLRWIGFDLLSGGFLQDAFVYIGSSLRLVLLIVLCSKVKLKYVKT